MNRRQIEDVTASVIDLCMSADLPYGVFVSDKGGLTASKVSERYFDKKTKSPYQTLIGVYDDRVNSAHLADDIQDALAVSVRATEKKNTKRVAAK